MPRRGRTALLFAILAGIAIITAAAIAAAVSDPRLVRLLDGGSVEAEGSEGVVDGWVKRVDRDTGETDIARGLLPFSAVGIAMQPETEIRIDDKIGSLDDLRYGLPVKVCYEVRGGQRHARAVETPPSDGPCRSVAATQTAPVPPADAPPAVTPTESTPAVDTPPALALPPRAPASPTIERETSPPPKATVKPDATKDMRHGPAALAGSRPAGASTSGPSDAAQAAPSAAPRSEAIRRTPAPRSTVDDAPDYEALVDWLRRR